ncbi:carbohydrate kinase family protein [Novisyntrophococcus fermenticellae]|uniref:carbohydrate kinase family protein n=1 Tax=Novisyntrophococcus fermenticellae TaxID=2068655 RepID=UPI001E385199|nr:carbohydrate kinase [Novisyntrophococcus fermenticellae]
MKSYDVTALGELLIDFTENGISGQGNPMFEANPGGAPCNVLAMLTKLGHKTAFIGKVGNDFFGKQLKATLDELGINSDHLLMDDKIHTTLALVHTYPDGDRDFSFYRNPGADMMLTEEEVPETLIRDSRIFHYGTLSMTDEGVRAATKKAIQIAEESGAIISLDPNLRPPLWNTLEEAREQVLYGLAHCQVLKISDNEIQWLTGEEDFTAGVNWIRSRFDIKLILVSMGREGSRAYYGDKMVEAAPFLQEKTIETTGAGDTFGGCILHYVAEHGLDHLTEEQLSDMLTFANGAASLITTKKGALRVMPEEKEIEGLIKSRAVHDKA